MAWAASIASTDMAATTPMFSMVRMVGTASAPSRAHTEVGTASQGQVPLVLPYQALSNNRRWQAEVHQALLLGPA